jgi:hypothetical protein
MLKLLPQSSLTSAGSQKPVLVCASLLELSATGKNLLRWSFLPSNIELEEEYPKGSYRYWVVAVLKHSVYEVVFTTKKFLLCTEDSYEVVPLTYMIHFALSTL